MAKSTKTSVEEIARPVVEQMDCIYVDTEISGQDNGKVVTVFIDKKGGVLLDDCEAVSRAVEARMDEEDPIADSYFLCVSSPGLDRPLKNDRDFERAMGEPVDVKLYKPFEGSKLFTGVLTAYGKDSVTIETEDDEMVFELKEVAKMSLHLDF
jgi:ribosome maturation factor RimP